jgi:23S rRNA (cytidine1920-2'-O)/16S rRNA (cytidine1409-2'-O)-methyltransferase
VKPQFELSPGDIGKGGIVKDSRACSTVERRICESCAAHGIAVREWFASPIAGGDGNQEFFVWGHAR